MFVVAEDPAAFFEGLGPVAPRLRAAVHVALGIVGLAVGLVALDAPAQLVQPVDDDGPESAVVAGHHVLHGVLRESCLAEEPDEFPARAHRVLLAPRGDHAHAVAARLGQHVLVAAARKVAIVVRRAVAELHPLLGAPVQPVQLDQRALFAAGKFGKDFAPHQRIVEPSA